MKGMRRRVEIEARPGGVYMADTDEALYCQWYAACPSDATTIVSHPVLGDVPTCARCAQRAGAV